ncbi:MAG TPA: hypothetical protein G4O18_09565 [Dehalococcoidia bacterium]|nr:hypothetical protein [Dehalococcoidia bacterium]
MQSHGDYPKDIVTVERSTEQSDGKRVVTAVANQSEEKAVLAAMSFMDAFNAADPKAARECLNYPHARVGADGTLVISETADNQMPAGFFSIFQQRTGWNHSCWDLREVIQSSETKVHLKVTFSRYRADGSLIGTYPSIWVMTEQDGHWGIKMRSSFAA